MVCERSSLANGTSRPDLQGLGAEFAVGYSGANFHFSPDSCVSADDLAYPKKQGNLYRSSSAMDPFTWMDGGTSKAFRIIRAEYDDLPRQSRVL